MKQPTLNIEDNKFNDFLGFIKTLDYVKVEDIEATAMKKLQSSLKQVRLNKEGKLPKQSAREFLNDLQYNPYPRFSETI